MESSFIVYPIILFSIIIGSMCHDDRILYPNFQISLSQFRRNCDRKDLLHEITGIQEDYATLLTEISQDLILKIYYKQANNSTIVNSALENLCINNDNLNNLLYNTAEKMLACLDNSKNVNANNLKQTMLAQICSEQKLWFFYNLGFYHNSNRRCFWDAARNISECFKEQCSRRLWRIAEDCECVGANCGLCNEDCYDPFYNNILVYAPINFNQMECDDLLRRVTCQHDAVKHCGNTHLKLTYEMIYNMDRVHRCFSRVSDWR